MLSPSTDVEEEEEKEMGYNGIKDADVLPPIHTYQQNHCIKNIRNISEITTYLEHFVPPYIGSTKLLNCVLFGILPLMINISFIVYSFIDLRNDTATNYDQQYLWAFRTLTVWIEFIGFLLISTGCILALIFGYNSTFIDCIGYISSWSAFKLFYEFRPKSLYDHYCVCFSQHSERLQETATKQSKQNKWRTLLNDLNDAIKHGSNFVSITDSQKLLKIQNDLQHVVDNIDDTQNDETRYSNFWEQKFRHIADPINEEQLNHRIKKMGTWVMLCIISIFLLSVGIISLICKVNQLSFANKYDIFSLSWYQYYMMVAFCNQLWNMSNAESIRIQSLYRFVYSESIKCKYSRYVAHRVCILDSVIKEKLWKHHGLRGFLLSFQLDWGMVYKILIKDEFDTLSVDEAVTHQRYISPKVSINTCNADTNNDKARLLMANYNKVSEDYQGKCDKLKESIYDFKRYLKMEVKWKLLHPSTVAQYELMRHYQKNNLFNLNEFGNKTNVFRNTIVLFERMEIYSKWIIPVLYILSFIFAILAFHEDSDMSLLMLWEIVAKSAVIGLLLMSLVSGLLCCGKQCVKEELQDAALYCTLFFVCSQFGTFYFETNYLVSHLVDVFQFPYSFAFLAISAVCNVFITFSIIVIIVSYIHFVALFACVWFMAILQIFNSYYVVPSIVIEVINIFSLLNCDSCFQKDFVQTIFDVYCVLLFITIAQFGIISISHGFYTCLLHNAFRTPTPGYLIVSVGKPTSQLIQKTKLWNEIMSISIFVFFWIHVVFVILYYSSKDHIIPSHVIHLDVILYLTIFSYLIPYSILVLYIAMVKQNKITFWIGQLNGFHNRSAHLTVFLLIFGGAILYLLSSLEAETDP
eukprot:235991_1